MNRPKVVVAWSSGKDSAWALHILRLSGAYDVVGLFVTLNAAVGRASMHGVRERLVDAQAAEAGLALEKVALPHPCSNEQYEAAMRIALDRMRAQGVTHVAFGDLFLEDIRAYREQRLSGTGIAPLFPLWGSDTAALAREMLQNGLEALVTCVDLRRLDASFAGRPFDAALLHDLPPQIDPCGERGELHTFVHAGPMFRRSIPVLTGDTVERDGFAFADVLHRQG